MFSIIFSFLITILGNCELTIDADIYNVQYIENGLSFTYFIHWEHQTGGDECFAFWGFEWAYYDTDGFPMTPSGPLPAGTGSSNIWAGHIGPHNVEIVDEGIPIGGVKLTAWIWCLRHTIVFDVATAGVVPDDE